MRDERTQYCVPNVTDVVSEIKGKCMMNQSHMVLSHFLGLVSLCGWKDADLRSIKVFGVKPCLGTAPAKGSLQIGVRVCVSHCQKIDGKSLC